MLSLIFKMNWVERLFINLYIILYFDAFRLIWVSPSEYKFTFKKLEKMMTMSFQISSGTFGKWVKFSAGENHRLWAPPQSGHLALASPAIDDEMSCGEGVAALSRLSRSSVSLCDWNEGQIRVRGEKILSFLGFHERHLTSLLVHVTDKSSKRLNLLTDCWFGRWLSLSQ